MRSRPWSTPGGTLAWLAADEVPIRSPLFVLALAYVLSFASGGIQLPLASTAMENVGLSMSAIGAMWALRSVLGVVGPPVWGLLADRRGDTRPFAAASLFFGAALLVVLAFAKTAGVAVAVFGLYGLLCAPSGAMIDGMVITTLADEKHRFGGMRAWGTVGFGLTALTAAVLVDRGVVKAVPHALFPACALLTGAAGVTVLFVPKLARPALGRARDALPLLLERDFVALFLTSMVLWCSHTAYSSFLMPLAVARGLPEWSVGASLAAALVVEALMLREAGRVLARFGARNVILATAVIAVLRWGLLAVTASPLAFVALNALHGVTFGLFYATLVALIAQKAPPAMRQAAQGVVGSSSFGLGGALGSLLVGVVLEHGGAVATWWSMTVVAALGLALAWRTVR